VLLSDFISSREFRRTAFYQDYYRHRGMRYQLGFAFAASETSTITVALNRWHGDFSADDRAVLTLLRPHFRRAYEFALARWLSVEEGGGRAASQADAVRLPQSLPLTADTDHRPRGAWVSVTSEGRLPECPALVRGWLESYYPTQRGATTPARRDHPSGELLPDNLRRWWQTRTSPRLDGLPWVGSTLAIENGAGRRLTVRVLRLPACPRTSSAGEAPTEGLLHFEEAPAVDRAAALRALGLTPRQAEVLWWLAHGKTNGEIGAILGASTHTVHHHVESILVQLGVISRAEATLRALEALGWLRWPQG
jgi:DNA-binding CsgD family transcriptional regulator